MSGPTTAILTGEPLTVILAASAIRAAAAIREGQERADALRGEHERERSERHDSIKAAQEQGIAALQEKALQTERRFQQLAASAERFGAGEQVRSATLEKKESTDPAVLATYVRALMSLCDELQAALLTESARRMQEAGEQGGIAPAETDVAAARRSARWLERIAHLGPLPEEIGVLARELDASPPGERAELLATELRRHIQLHAEAAQKKAVQEATSVVIAQSLKDLGYQVEDIAETLFVEGGTVHFRRGGWGNYMVRMRVDAKTSTVNFNVIRAVKQGENERSVLDHLAEDRWCAEFPALLKALEARGVTLDVTRRLEAGELPVQLVNADKLPAFKDEETSMTSAKPMAREIK